MASVVSCPNCGAPLKNMGVSQELVCGYCGAHVQRDASKPGLADPGVAAGAPAHFPRGVLIGGAAMVLVSAALFSLLASRSIGSL